MLAPRAVSYLLLVLVTVVHLLAQLLAPEGGVAEATQPLLVPALAAVLVTGTPAPRLPLVRVTLVALFFSHSRLRGAMLRRQKALKRGIGSVLVGLGVTLGLAR